MIWAMMILPLADTLQNCLQNLTSRIAGLDNEQMTGRVMGMGAILGFGLGAIKEQFRNPETANFSNNGWNINNGSSQSGFSGFINRAKSLINPNINLSDEKDYNGNINPIRNVESKTNNSTIPIQKNNSTNTNTTNNNTKINPKSIVSKVAKTGYNATKGYLKMGANLAEGFNTNQNTYKLRNKNKYYSNNFKTTEYINNIDNDHKEIQKSGDDNEFNEKK